MRPVVVNTAARVLGSRHPRSITKVKAIRTLYSGVTHLPGKQQKLLNQLGDTFSKQTSLKMMDAACQGHDREIYEIVRGVESLWLGKMADATPRARQRMAKKFGITGGCRFGDNVGIVSDGASHRFSYWASSHLTATYPPRAVQILRYHLGKPACKKICLYLDIVKIALSPLFSLTPTRKLFSQEKCRKKILVQI